MDCVSALTGRSRQYYSFAPQKRAIVNQLIRISEILEVGFGSADMTIGKGMPKHACGIISKMLT